MTEIQRVQNRSRSSNNKRDWVQTEIDLSRIQKFLIISSVNQSKLKVVYVVDLVETTPQKQESLLCGYFEESYVQAVLVF